MPVYEYQCKACGKEFEYQQRMSDPDKTTCEACGKDELERLISRTAFQLKGSGWYKDLYSSSKPDSKPSTDAATPAPAATTTADKPAAAADKPAPKSDAGGGSTGSSGSGSTSGSGSGSGGSSSGGSGGSTAAASGAK